MGLRYQMLNILQTMPARRQVELIGFAEHLHHPIQIRSLHGFEHSPQFEGPEEPLQVANEWCAADSAQFVFTVTLQVFLRYQMHVELVGLQ